MFLYKLYQIHHIQLILEEQYDLIELFDIDFDIDDSPYALYLLVGININNIKKIKRKRGR